jgi:hypothetical protein
MNGQEKRRHERIRIPYILKFRSLASNASRNWDAANPIDVSEKGICFLSAEQFIPGTDMFLLATNPLIEEERIYDCKVLRSDPTQEGSHFFKTVVTIENMDEETRKAYRKLLETFIQARKAAQER